MDLALTMKKRGGQRRAWTFDRIPFLILVWIIRLFMLWLHSLMYRTMLEFCIGHKIATVKFGELGIVASRNGICIDQNGSVGLELLRVSSLDNRQSWILVSIDANLSLIRLTFPAFSSSFRWPLNMTFLFEYRPLRTLRLHSPAHDSS